MINSPASQEQIRQAAELLPAWFSVHRRILPWREDPTPYHVWISEIMLQQTRVEAVIPYYLRFIGELPDLAALASCEEDRLLKLWEGLGYYSRARNLKKAAGQILEDFHGRIPDRREDLLRLAGIGSYTAGAIASIAYGRPEPAVDGNVIRVILRLLGEEADPKDAKVRKEIEEVLRISMPREGCSAFNQSLFEIGALLCIPNGSPRCVECPLSSCCRAGKEARTEQIPKRVPKAVRRQEAYTVLLIRDPDHILLIRRPPQGLLASLYAFPMLSGHVSQEEAWQACLAYGIEPLRLRSLPGARHIFTHIEWQMTGYEIETRALPETFPGLSSAHRASLADLQDQYAIPSAYAAFLRCLFKEITEKAF